MRLVAAVSLAAAVMALVQLGVVPLFFLDGRAAPVLPVALIAAWAAVREPAETVPALLVTAVALGVASQERVGWFLLALLPAALLAALVRSLLDDEHDPSKRRLALAAGGAGAGAIAYLVLLAIAAGAAAELGSNAARFALAGLLTASLGGLFAVALWPTRPRPEGLFR